MSDKIWTYAATHYGDRLRDMNIGVSVWTRYEDLIAAVRMDFDDEIEWLDDDERQEAMSDDEKLLEHLRWYSNVIISIDQHKVVEK